MRVILLFIVIIFAPYSPLTAGKVEIEVINVGQGNCILVTARHSQKPPQHMLVDIGTSSYKKEISYTEFIFNQRQEDEDMPNSESPDSSFSSPTIPKSTMKKVKPYLQLEEGDWRKGQERQKKGEEIPLLQDLRKKLGKTGETKEKKSKESIQSIYVKTVVITHPDKDHYGWITRLFSEKEDHIDYIIFGGLPEHYDMSGDLKLKDWIKARLKEKSKIYFPAIQYQEIKSLEEVMPHKKRSWAPQKISSATFHKALDFGTNVKASFLSINPTHFMGEGNEILRMSTPEDDNADSLVLKIENGKSSAILTGDATGLTTTRIINNFHDKKEHLNTNVLLASHHGSSTHGSNNEEWITATQPEFIIISNGLLHGHPHEEAYDIFKKSPRLKRVTEHNILIAQSSAQGMMHKTQNPIFSTLTSGTILLDLLENGGIGIKINTDESAHKQKINIHKNKEDKKETEDAIQEVSIIEENEKFLITPKKSSKTPQMESLSKHKALSLNFSSLESEETPKKKKAQKQNMTPLKQQTPTKRERHLGNQSTSQDLDKKYIKKKKHRYHLSPASLSLEKGGKKRSRDENQDSEEHRPTKKRKEEDKKPKK
jgi:beta-lactamase superfamily II metal-dependent hydrolase